MTIPSHGPQTLSTASAIRAEAFPAPMITTRPLGFLGNIKGITSIGSATKTALLNN